MGPFLEVVRLEIFEWWERAHLGGRTHDRERRFTSRYYGFYEKALSLDDVASEMGKTRSSLKFVRAHADRNLCELIVILALHWTRERDALALMDAA
jgi:hypothetical protein